MRQRSPDDEILKDEYYRDNRGEIDRRSQQSIQPSIGIMSSTPDTRN